MTIGTNIRRLRQNKGITQEQLGDAVGVSGQAVSKWENESTLPDILSLPKLADYFGISIDDLMSTGLTMCERIDRLKAVADIEITAVVIIADLTNEEAKAQGLGTKMVEEKYGTKVYSIITTKDIETMLKK